ncbi:MAG: shikimate kinase [Alistipes sp.]|nr:shikimate kinase [Alistipes sp.]
MRIYLIGYMGCGKSTIARKVARLGSMQFVDTDSVVEQRENCSVADVITHCGEEYFRQVEREALLSTAECERAIISTGGGLPMWSDNMEQIRRLGGSVYLRRSPAKIISRLSPYGRAKRPKFRGLNDEELLEFMTKHMAEREPVYIQADEVIDCDTMSDDMVVDRILAMFDSDKK